MSTTTIHYPSLICVRRSLVIQWIKILIILSLVLITGAILVKVSSTPRDSFQADPIDVVENSIMPIAVPVATPPMPELQPIPTKTPAPASLTANQPRVIPVPVPTPPSL